jgi:hypothetical protein
MPTPTSLIVEPEIPSKYNLNCFCLCLLPPKSRWLGSRHNADRSVLPSAAKEEEIKLGSANGEPQLRLLGVDFLRKQTIDLNNHVLRVRESDWPPELRPRTGLLLLRLTAGVNQEAAKLGSIELNDLKKGIITARDINEASPILVPTIDAILSVMRLQESKQPSKVKRVELVTSQTGSLVSLADSTQSFPLPISSGSHVIWFNSIISQTGRTRTNHPGSCH